MALVRLSSRTWHHLRQTGLVVMGALALFSSFFLSRFIPGTNDSRLLGSLGSVAYADAPYSESSYGYSQSRYNFAGQPCDPNDITCVCAIPDPNNCPRYGGGGVTDSGCDGCGGCGGNCGSGGSGASGGSQGGGSGDACSGGSGGASGGGSGPDGCGGGY